MGNLIDISILFVLILITTRIANKIAKTKFKKYLAFIAILLVLVFITSPVVISIENCLFNFKTPEDVFYFTHTEEIVDTVYGNDSCMIIYSKGKEGVAQEYILKSGNAYKIPYSFSSKKISYFVKNDTVFNVYNVSGTNDYYIIGSVITNETPLTVKNSKNKEVKYYTLEHPVSDCKIVNTYDVVNELSNYYIIINDEKFYMK